MTDPKGLYATLDVSPGVSEDELKKAYRRLALRWHPDKNPDDPEATAKFQKISNAYAVLSDERQRRIYDDTGRVGEEEMPGGGCPEDIEEMMEMFAAAFDGIFIGDGLDEEFAAMFGQGGQRRRRRGKIPQRLRTAAAPGAKAPRPRGSRGGLEEMLLQEMAGGFFGGGANPFGGPAGFGPAGFGSDDPLTAAMRSAAGLDGSDEEGGEDAEEKKAPKPRGHNQPLRPKKAKGKKK